MSQTGRGGGDVSAVHSGQEPSFFYWASTRLKPSVFYRTILRSDILRLITAIGVQYTLLRTPVSFLHLVARPNIVGVEESVIQVC